MSERMVLTAIVLIALSGVPGLWLNRHGSAGQWLTTLLAVAGAACGLAGLGVFWMSGVGEPIDWPWSLPGAAFSVGMDGLSAIFLWPIFLISMLGSIYGLDYWKQSEHPENGRKLRLFYGLLTAGMALLVIARNSIVFLFGWEIMALAGYFVVTTEDHQEEVRAAGWVYLIASHLASLCLLALFGLLRTVSGSFALVRIAESNLTPGLTTAIFVLALLGFGLKAGLMPMHVWLPSAHAIAPSHVSALMSGVLLKMGIYGLVRVTALMPPAPQEWGGIVLVLGVISGVLGVAFAVGQRDLKRLLAYSSIENIGIIIMGLGLAVLGRSLGRRDLVFLGLSGALLHVWNHALFKSLLFLGAGSIIHATQTRQIDQLGGLAKRMPRTALFFLVGAVAICALPPLNGFASEFLIYLGLLRTLADDSAPNCAEAALAAPALALIGALALACFVKVFGAVFLGSPRSEHGQHAHESSLSMLGPMGVLVAGCLLIGLAPGSIRPILEMGVAVWAPELQDGRTNLGSFAPLGRISVMNLVLIAGLSGVSVLGWLRFRQQPPVFGPTWGCGYSAGTPRIQYTSSSFAALLVALFGWFLRPKINRPAPLPIFPGKTEFHTDVADPVLEEALRPSFRAAGRFLSWFRVLQQGNIQAYLLYIFLILLVLLCWRY